MRDSNSCRIFGLTMVFGLTVGGCRGPLNGKKGVFEGTILGAAAGKIANMAGVDSRTATAIGTGVAVASGVTVYVIEKRRAEKEEQRAAEERAEKMLKEANEKERKAINENNTHIAVRVPDSRQSQDKTEIIIVDPKTGRTVDSNVYVVGQSSKPYKDGDKIDLGDYEAIYVE